MQVISVEIKITDQCVLVNADKSKGSGKIGFVKELRIINNNCKLRFFFTRAKINNENSLIKLDLYVFDNNLKPIEPKESLYVSLDFIRFKNKKSKSFIEFDGSIEIYEELKNMLLSL